MPQTPRLRRPAALLACAAALLTLLGCGSTGSAGGDAQTGFVSGENGLDAVPPASRRPAPALAGKDLEGRPTALSDYRGETVVVNIWASWCDGCRAEAAGLEQVHRKYQGQGVRFLGINTRETDRAVAVAFEKQKGITFPSIYDPDGTQILKFPKGSLDPQSIPSTLVIDRQGNVAARSLKAISADDLEAMLRPVLAER
ncbi:TlpA family protein disulfide reductase [Kitasatospora sp. HPMI-4]|uniref:TlpA family protein disulfide reductase n=1 Tax=Kitasatospora sp. HPMI-4 TaxID=3448443 RepID=UPI003F1C882C